jgi:hypothetical protein
LLPPQTTDSPCAFFAAQPDHGPKREKTISNGDKIDSCAPGGFLGIPAPASFDMVNEPDEHIRQYLALCIPFESGLVERFLRLYPGMASGDHKKSAIPIKGYDALYAAVLHFLQMADSPGQDRDVLKHRLLEILLCLVKNSTASQRKTLTESA